MSKGTFSVEVSTWERPGPVIVRNDNSFGRDSYQRWDDGKAMEVAISVTVHPAEDMVESVHKLMAMIEQAGFIRQ